MATPASAEALWWPSADAVSSSRTARFRETVNAKFGLRLAHYDDLLAWSIAHPGDFWAAVWDDTAVVAAAKGAHVVDVTAKPADSPVWFADARLNWAANMLRCRDPAKRALVELDEPHPRHPTPALRELSYAGLYALVADLVSALLGAGLVRGDRVASYSSNCIVRGSRGAPSVLGAETHRPTGERRGLPSGDSDRCTGNLRRCSALRLLTHCTGCVWISAAADFGADGVLERCVTRCLDRVHSISCALRFEQVQPSLIFTVDAVSYDFIMLSFLYYSNDDHCRYNGKIHPHVPKVRTLLSGLAQKGVPAPRVVVIDSAAKGGAAISEALDPSWVRWDAFVAEGTAAKRGRTPEGEIEFAQLPFDWPLWILFSSVGFISTLAQHQ
jgi:acetoacetyl-CoA synthetase